MTVSFRTAKIGIMLGILLVSLFTVFIPNVRAAGGPIKNWLKDNAYVCYIQGKIDYDEDAAKSPILPLTKIKTIPMTFSMKVTGYFFQDMLSNYKGTQLYGGLSITKTPEWCTASVFPAQFIMLVSNSISTISANIIVGVNENASAFMEGKITVCARLAGIGAIKTGTFYQDVLFTPGYLPFLKIDVPKGTSELIGPGDTANFDLEIENQGNAKTEITCNVLDVPKGWSAHIEPNTLIGTRSPGDDPKKTLQLVVKPPYGFGYHDEREVIQVSITPSYFDNKSLVGDEYNLSFIIQSRGFSTPGFETVFVIFALITMALIAKKQQRKKRFNIHNGEDDT